MKQALIYVIASLVVLGASLFALMSFHEWWLIGVAADPDTIAKYRFGSEAMVGHGGAKYASAVRYSYTQLICGLVSLCAAAAAIFSVRLRSAAWLSASAVVPILALLGSNL